jgi:hypothetical protein
LPNMALHLPPSEVSPDVFGRLPREILLQLMKVSAGLSPLWSLINASPACSDLFDDCALEILEAVMAATVPSTIQCRMRATFRWSILGRPPTLDDTRNIISLSSIGYVALTLTESDTVHGVELPRRFLSLAHKIHLLSHACFDYYIEASLSMRPSYLVKMGPLQKHVPGEHRLLRYRSKYDTAESKAYLPNSTGPPSWVEEHRVLKALWLLQYFFQLKTEAYTGRLAWPTDDLSQIPASKGGR